MLHRVLLCAIFALVSIADALYSRDIDETLHVLKQRRRLKEPQSLLPIFVNPFSPVLLCDWHYSSEEPDTYKGDRTWTQISTVSLNKSSAGDVKPCESVCVDVTMIESFVTKILPLIKVKILLFTHRWCMPQLRKSDGSRPVSSERDALVRAESLLRRRQQVQRFPLRHRSPNAASFRRRFFGIPPGFQAEKQQYRAPLCELYAPIAPKTGCEELGERGRLFASSAVL